MRGLSATTPTSHGPTALLARAVQSGRCDGAAVEQAIFRAHVLVFDQGKHITSQAVRSEDSNKENNNKRKKYT